MGSCRWFLEPLELELTTERSSIHYHGLHQLNSNHMDGVPGVTECPIAPGNSKTHSFIASQYGTAW